MWGVRGHCLVLVGVEPDSLVDDLCSRRRWVETRVVTLTSAEAGCQYDVLCPRYALREQVAFLFCAQICLKSNSHSRCA